MKRGKDKYYSKKDSEIPLILKDYNDIFSGFDPRDYSQRAISHDFLLECKNASLDKKKNINLHLFFPKNKRSLAKETEIRRRLKEHFNKHFLEKKKELFNLKAIGSIWFATGCFLTAVTALFMEKDISFSMKVLVNLAHPAGWFFLWEGMGKILIHSKEKKEDYDFNRKMNEAKISFFSS